MADRERKAGGIFHADVHLAFIDRIPPRRLADFRALLDLTERERHDRFKVEGARTEFLVGRALLRTTLSRLRPDVFAENWRFAPNAYGRPAIDWDGTNAKPSDLHFNLSHTRGLVAMIVAPNEAIGVDVEAITRGAPEQDVARRFFTKAEADWIDRGAEETDRTERFFALWTLKEAYIKARGMGLSLPLDGFFFDCTDPPVIAFNDKIDDHAGRWCFERLIIDGAHRLALARPVAYGATRFFEAEPLDHAPAPIHPPIAAALS